MAANGTGLLGWKAAHVDASDADAVEDSISVGASISMIPNLSAQQIFFAGLSVSEQNRLLASATASAGGYDPKPSTSAVEGASSAHFFVVLRDGGKNRFPIMSCQRMVFYLVR